MSVDVMAIGAHPDDVEIGMGGTIASLVAAGKSVVVVDLSNGEPTPYGTPELRMREAAEAAEILGVQRVTLDMQNREIMDSVPNRKKLAGVIRQFRPALLFMPYPSDAHPDHEQAVLIARAARFYAKLTKTDMPFEPHYPRKVFHYVAIHERIQVQPSFIYDISLHIDTKIQAISAYSSQFANNDKNAHVVEYIRNGNSYWGSQAGCEYGEPFTCLESIRITSAESLLDA